MLHNGMQLLAFDALNRAHLCTESQVFRPRPSLPTYLHLDALGRIMKGRNGQLGSGVNLIVLVD